MSAIAREIEDRVWRRAYELWKEAGRPEERGDEFGRQARAEITPNDVPDANRHVELASSFDNPSWHNNRPRPVEPLA